MASRFKAARVGAAILGASVALMVSALPALAEVKVVIDSDGDKNGLNVRLEGKDQSFTTQLIGLRIVDTKTLVQSYCVEIHQAVKDDAGMVEVPWDKHPNGESGLHDAGKRGKINWILNNSYPAVEVEKLDELLKRKISPEEAIAATQVAIWHFSDGAKLDADPLKEGNAESKLDVTTLYKYLTEDATNPGLDVQPAPTLDIAPKDKVGKAGELIGPFVVTTTADKIAVKGALDGGATLTDKDGNKLSEVKPNEFAAEATGDKVTDIYVKVPADADKGEAKFTVEVDAELKTGRLFIRSDSNNKTQSLVVASPVKVSVKSEAKAVWDKAPVIVPPVPSETSSSTPTSTTTTAPTTTTTPAPVAGGGSTDDNLASTGASIFVPLIVGIGLLGAGAGALLLIRRRKATA